MKTRKQLKSLFGGDYDWMVVFLYYTGCMRIYQHSGGPADMIAWYVAPRKWNPILWLWVIVFFTFELVVGSYKLIQEWREDGAFEPTRLRLVEHGDSKLFGYEEGRAN
jgi:hypothetical protein